jgi:serine protease Do
MNTNNIWEIAEAYLDGTLSPEEVAVVNTRLKADADFAAEFNENINLINSLNNNGKQKRFRSMLGDIHQKQFAAKKSRLVSLPAHFWRTAAIAAGVALITSISTYTIFVNSARNSASQYSTISREVEHIKTVQRRQQEQQNAIIDSIKKKNSPSIPTSEVRYTGTGFALTNDGYFATAYHVINYGKFDSVYIQCNDDKYYKAVLVNYNEKTDIAILKVEKKNFKFGKNEVPYTLGSNKSSLAERIFTIGYPKDDMVYSEGYVSAKNGFNDNAEQFTLALPAGHGQSGSPVVDAKGSIVGVLTGISGPEEANTYAATVNALNDVIEPIHGSMHLSKKNKLANVSREKQIEAMSNYTFSVKVYKK